MVDSTPAERRALGDARDVVREHLAAHEALVARLTRTVGAETAARVLAQAYAEQMPQRYITGTTT